MPELDKLLARQDARVVPGAQQANARADLDAVADYHQACIQNRKAGPLESACGNYSRVRGVRR